MDKFLSADTDEELVEVAAKLEIIFINAWLGNYKLERFPSILILNCTAKTLFDISKNYKNIKISSLRNQDDEKVYFVKKWILYPNKLI